MALENYVSDISYIIAVLFLTVFGRDITDNGIIPLIKSFTSLIEKNIYFRVVLGTIIYIIWALIGVKIIQYIIENKIINAGNVVVVAIVCFLAVAFYLEEKYRISRG